MIGLSPQVAMGYGISTIIWVFAIVIVVGIVWRGRARYLLGTPIVLQRFRVNEDPGATVAVEISGRLSGIVSWILTLLNLEPTVELTVTDSEFKLCRASLSGILHTYIPLEKVTAAVCGYQRSILALGFAILFSVGFVLNLLSGFLEISGGQGNSDMGLALGFLILAAICGLVYFLSKKIGVGVESSLHAHGLTFKRSVIENVSVDLPDALRVISAINSRVLAAQRMRTISASSNTPSSQSPSGDVPPRTNLSGSCPHCGSAIEPGSGFCENCGAKLD
jgi:hypothetical protein